MQTNPKTATTCVDTAIAKSIPQSALHLISALEATGFEAWIVGGAVRDAVMGHTCHDIDIATQASCEQTSQVAQSIGFDIHETGVKHGTVTAVAPDPARNAYEVTTYRTDGSYSDGRHPDEVHFVRTIDEDLARRDFTMNAMAWHPTRGLHDPYNGASDIANATIRVVGNARKRFGEDALRILRAARFASQLGFEIEPATFQAMHEQKHMLVKVSHERISAEIDRLLLGKNVASVLVD
jgi:tRNA nucleotidyltransferase (CCA-adding enzyme)